MLHPSPPAASAVTAHPPRVTGTEQPGCDAVAGARTASRTSEPWRERLHLLASCAAVIAAGFTCYAHTLDVPWYLDDLHAIVKNPSVQDLRSALGGVLAPRGLTNLTFAVNFALSGPSLGAFHATNIAMHLASGVLALLVLRRVFPGRALLAAVGALVFVAHPLQTQAVTYVVQRLAVVAALLCLAATYLYLLARDALETGASPLNARFLAPYTGALVCGAAALLGKENAAALPALILVCELFLPRAATRPGWRRLLWIVPFAAVPAYYGLTTLGLRFLLPAGGAAAPASVEADVVGDPGAASRLAYLSTELEVIWRYVRLVVWPVGQVFDAGIAVSPQPFRAASVAAGGALAAVVAASVALRKRAPQAAFGALWFLAALSVESSVILLDPYFEHRLYLPMLGASALIAWTLGRAFRDARVRAAVGLAMIAALSGLAYRRNAEWRDPAKLWAADMRAGSASYRSAMGLADAHYRRGEESLARQAYADLLSRGSERCRAGGCGSRYLLNLGVAAERLGRLDSASHFYARALQADPAYALAHFGLGVASHRAGRKEEALAHFKEAVRLAPGDTLVLFNLCTVALELGDRAPAERNLARIRSFDPKRAADLERDLAAATADERAKR